MFKRKEVEEMRDTVYYKDGDEITFGSVQNALAAQARAGAAAWASLS